MWIQQDDRSNIGGLHSRDNIRSEDDHATILDIRALVVTVN